MKNSPMPAKAQKSLDAPSLLAWTNLLSSSRGGENDSTTSAKALKKQGKNEHGGLEEKTSIQNSTGGPGGKEENDRRSSRGPKASNKVSSVDMIIEAPFCHQCDTLRHHKFQH